MELLETIREELKTMFGRADLGAEGIGGGFYETVEVSSTGVLSPLRVQTKMVGEEVLTAVGSGDQRGLDEVVQIGGRVRGIRADFTLDELVIRGEVLEWDHGATVEAPAGSNGPQSARS